LTDGNQVKVGSFLIASWGWWLLRIDGIRDGQRVSVADTRHPLADIRCGNYSCVSTPKI
jgi:hypothetical protein